MPAVRLLRTLVAFGMSLCLLALAAGPAATDPISAAPPGAAPLRIFVLRGGDSASDNAVIAALEAADYEVTGGPETPDFSGAEADLADYDLVVALYNSNFSRALNPAGVAALVEYVRSGGGLLAGEWMAWQSANQGLAELAEILPASSCGLNSAGQTTFRQVIPNPVINAGLPTSFSIPLANLSGSEGCLEPKPEAAVFYSSSNGGGRAGGAAGLVAWNPPGSDGRVASFSTLLSAAELTSGSMRQLLQSTADWLAKGKDMTPPTLKQLQVEGAGTLRSTRDLSIDIQASDRGGARMGYLYVVEYVYSGDTQAPWEAVQRSGWLSWGNGGNHSLEWQLTAEAGVHYLQIFLADRAGNVTPVPGLDFVSYQPDSASVGLEQQRIYRIRPGVGGQISVRMEVISGNPDLYVFGPNVSFAPWSDDPVEEVRFSGAEGIYQIEVEGYAPGSYRLSVGAPGNNALAEGPAPKVRRRTSIITLSAYAPEPEDAALPPSPAEVGPASVGRIIYLPLVRR